MRPSGTKLRTNKGCAACRTRRKKCDERKPQCATCERLGLKCSWPDPDSLEDRRKRGAINSRWSPRKQGTSTPKPPSLDLDSNPGSSPSRSSLSENSPEKEVEEVVGTSTTICYPSPYFRLLSSAQAFLRSDREVVLLTSYYENFIPSNILPKAHSNFYNTDSGDTPVLIDAAFACSSMQLANKYETPPVEAYNYYTRAVSRLRKRLDAGEVTGLEDWLLTVTVLLHCFETWCCDADYSALSTFQHLLGAIQLLKQRCKPTQSQSWNDICILMAESVLFHVSTLTAYSPSFSSLGLDSSLWDWLEVVFEASEYHDDLSSVNHPVLGIPRKLNKIVFEVSKLSLCQDLTAKDLLDKKRLDAELTVWEMEDKSYLTLSKDVERDSYLEVRRLYTLCTRILLLQVEATSKSLDDATLESRINTCRLKAMSTLSEMVDTGKAMWNFVMRWPLFVIGQIVESESDRQLIQECLNKIWINNASGDVKRALGKLQRLWSENSSHTNTCEVTALNGKRRSSISST